MIKLPDSTGIKLIGMDKEDGQPFVAEDDRIILTNQRELYNVYEHPELFKSGGYRFRIEDLITFLQDKAGTGQTHIEFATLGETAIEVNREEMLSEQAFREYVKERERVAVDEIMFNGLTEEEQCEMIKEISADTEREFLFVERGLSISVGDRY